MPRHEINKHLNSLSRHIDALSSELLRTCAISKSCKSNRSIS